MRNPRRIAMYEALQKSHKKLLGSRLGQTSRSIWNRPSPEKKKVSDPSLLRQQQQPVVPQPPAPSKVTAPSPKTTIPGQRRPDRQKIARIGWIIAGTVVVVVAGYIGFGLLRSKPNDSAKPNKQVEVTETTIPERVVPQPKAEPQTTVPAKPKPVEPIVPATADVVRDHVLVIATYTRNEDLEPVRDYFGQNGVVTEILKRGSYYYLVTKARYPNPRRPGSEGAVALDKIKQIGAKYKAPKGYERFDNTPFQDAYGMKLKPE